MTENTSATEPVAKELTMTDKPEQWAVELLDAVFDASDLGSACGIVDCPQCANAALTIQRAFEERDRKLRETGQFLLDRLVDHEVRMTSDKDGREWLGHVAPAMARFRQALKETPDAQ